MTAELLTIDALKSKAKCPVWIETRNSNLYNGWALVYEFYNGPSLKYMNSERVGITQPSGHIMWLIADWYGEKWRCWTDAPTKEQMDEEVWQ